MKLNEVVENIVQDTGIDLTQEFDRNFERKAFFTDKWKETKHPNSRGSLMLRSGKLRKSINKTQGSSEIRWRSSLPYATIHNEGGEIEVTAKMKKFFWAMYYKSSGAITTRRDGSASKSQRNIKLTAEAKKWKAMALMPVGTKMKIEQRQFIGWHPEVDKRVETIIDHNLQEYNKSLIEDLKQ
ncbi:phage virion morphogenesis protein [Leeuwenhoekiella parthenopeia]|uniref:Phage virion morphogenesis protein n=1 Tax=Leeuwenhoekiella parthenopeia TaxID=2890320 RepID=A0ABS8GQD8_9FLAO|nr:phage virion morphogenesis protein [Leeuwenhoekiella parthenopeia]MCC4211366.1 phage virion morphogenesis protein [Leeuwenhoekiella parthenopeia]